MSTCPTVPEHGPRAAPTSARSRLGILGIAAWALLAAGLLAALTAYSQRAGHHAPPPDAARAGLELPPQRWTLIMAVHPRCPCTAASIYELERLLARCSPSPHVTLLLYEPSAAEPGWARNAADSLRTRLPTSHVRPDPDGRLAARLGCLTSGAVVLYDASGTPRFWGGVTAARGHAGDNPGADAIVAIVNSATPSAGPTPVFGCAITAQAARDSECPGGAGHE